MDIKSPNKKPVENHKANAGAGRAQGINALAIALQQEKAAAQSTAKLRVGLRAAAQRYLDSNFDPRSLPPNKDLHPAVKELAATMDHADQFVWGEYYAPPNVVDVTALSLSDATIDPVAFFGGTTSQRQISGGSYD